MTLDPKIKIKIKVKGDLNIGQPTPPPIPALPPANSFQIGNSLNGSENWGTSDNMDGWGIERETKPEKKEELPKEVDTTTPEAAKPEREEKPENSIPKPEAKPPVEDKQEPKEKFKPLPNKIPIEETPFEVPKGVSPMPVKPSKPEGNKPPVNNELPTEEPPVEEIPVEEPPVEEIPVEEPKGEEVKETPKELTPAKIKAARQDGEDVADMLVGYTDDSEERLVTDIINEKVNSENVMEFITGYTENKGWGDKFFEQLQKEYGFDEAKNLMKKVATHLSEYYKNNGELRKAREISVILEENGFSNEDAKKLDVLTSPES